MQEFCFNIAETEEMEAMAFFAAGLVKAGVDFETFRKGHQFVIRLA